MHIKKYFAKWYSVFFIERLSFGPEISLFQRSKKSLKLISCLQEVVIFNPLYSFPLYSPTFLADFFYKSNKPYMPEVFKKDF